MAETKSKKRYISEWHDYIGKSKKRYISEWHDYIGALNTLAFTKDEKLSKRVRYHVKQLKKLVVQIAETKNLR